MIDSALTVLQPYAWAIVNGAKTEEFRKWQTAFRGRLAIHASGMQVIDKRVWEEFHAIGCPEELDARAIVGSVRVMDMVRTSEGWAWQLSDPLEYAEPIVEVKGALGIWRLPEAVAKKVAVKEVW